jgi:hypothetical protein
MDLLEVEYLVDRREEASVGAGRIRVPYAGVGGAVPVE